MGIESPKYINITKEFLYKEYIINKKSSYDIAKMVNGTQTAIYKRLLKYNILIRKQKKKSLKKHYCLDCGKELKYYKSKRCLSCARCGKNNPMFGKTKKLCPNYIDGRTLKKNYCIDCGIEIYWKSKRCSSCDNKEKFRNNVFEYKGKPNKPERLLNKLLQKLLPREYKYVGNNKIIIDTLCPDFINCNGQKKIIEMYGDYWHNLPNNKKRDKRRLITYAKYGYKTLIIWEHELKDINKVSNRIKEFNYGL